MNVFLILWVRRIPPGKLWRVVGWDGIRSGGNRFYQGLFLMVTHVPQPLLHITMVFPIEWNKYLIIYPTYGKKKKRKKNQYLNKTPKQITKLILSYALEFEVSLKWQVVLDYHSGYGVEKQQGLGKNCIIANYNNNSIKSLVPQLPHLWYYYIPFICLLCVYIHIYVYIWLYWTGENREQCNFYLFSHFMASISSVIVNYS